MSLGALRRRLDSLRAPPACPPLDDAFAAFMRAILDAFPPAPPRFVDVSPYCRQIVCDPNDEPDGVAAVAAWVQRIVSGSERPADAAVLDGLPADVAAGLAAQHNLTPRGAVQALARVLATY